MKTNQLTEFAPVYREFESVLKKLSTEELKTVHHVLSTMNISAIKREIKEHINKSTSDNQSINRSVKSGTFSRKSMMLILIYLCIIGMIVFSWTGAYLESWWWMIPAVICWVITIILYVMQFGVYPNNHR